MHVYLIRHTAPDVVTGTCYGRLDLPLKNSFREELAALRPHVPENLAAVYTSPLSRCRQLAEALHPAPVAEPDLQEIHCGDWEGRHWDEIPDTLIDAWYENRLANPFPNGESYETMYERVKTCFARLTERQGDAIGMVTHGGVIRCILAWLSHTPLEQSFKSFSLRYGGVVRITRENNVYRWKILHNPPCEQAEQHQPSRLLNRALPLRTP